MSVTTVKVSNVSLSTPEGHVEGYFSFSGEIEYVEMRSGDESSKIAYVTFKDYQGADNALLLSDAKIDGQSVVIAAATDYQLPPAASDPQESAGGSRSALQKTVGVFKKTAKKTRDFGLKHRPEFTFEAKFPIFGGKNQKPECNLIVEKKV
ncbi:binding partner of ACD11 1-like isoform X2 [Elaeis guineensis]|uniref:binding partner of ACD11 1-like isoform X2 n=1 Tax=Elaeis guineensis var. tenera TaxID=51953 RepID=UPI003C6D0714